jgi:hypothetical protein
MENQVSEVVLSQKPKTNFVLWIVIGVAILAAGIGVGLAVGRYSSSVDNIQKQVQKTELPENSPPVAPTEVTDSIANWKAYTSSKANYSFKYPVEWPLINVITASECTVCVENIDFTPVYNPDSAESNIATILIFKEEKIKTLEDYVNIHVKGDSSKVNLQYTTVGGQKAVSYKLSGGIPPLPIIEYAVVKNNLYYIIRLDDSVETNKNRDRNIYIFDQVLSTFKFANTQSIATPTLTSKATSLYYKLPNGWKTIQNEKGEFEMGYDSERTTTNLTYGPGAISIFINGTIGGAAMAAYLADYDGGSRHTFIFSQMGVPPTKGDAPEKYKEVEYVYNGKSCLFLENLYYSQSPSIWGMCDVGKGKAILMTASIPDYATTLQTIKIIK